MNRVVIILLVLFGLWSEYAEGQYFDRYVIYDESGLISSKEPLKSIMQLDMDILKKNKVKEVKVNYTKSSYRIYNILDSGFLSEINSFSYNGYSYDSQELYYYNKNNKTDSIISKKFIPGSLKVEKDSRDFFYEDNKLKYIVKTSQDTIYWIDYFFYDKILNRDTFSLQYKNRRNSIYTADYLVRYYDSSIMIKDYSTRQWTQTDSIYRSGDTIIDRQNNIFNYKIFLKNNRILKEEGQRRVYTFYTDDYIDYSPNTFSYFYRSDGLIDYIIMEDENNHSRKIKFSYSFYN